MMGSGIGVSWRVEDGLVLENHLAGPDVGRIVIRSPEVVRTIQPGQFVMVRCWEGEPLLPRAMAPLDYDLFADTMEIFYKIVGPGTRAMAGAQAGAAAHIIGPLGQVVDERFDGRTVALVGRGVGITPLLPLGRHVVATGGSVLSYLSARRSGYLFGLERFMELGPVWTAVDENAPTTRLVTSFLAEVYESQRVDVIYVCGSRRLIRHAVQIGERYGCRTYAFLEEKMGCGIGYCKGCPVSFENGTYKLVCTDGPLFPASEVVLN